MSFPGQSVRNTARTVLSLGLALVATTVLAGNAFAVGLRVQIACAGDYYAHCSAYSPDSPQVRSCMRAVGTRLSKGCVSALVATGEVSSAEVKRRSSTLTASK